jgi:uncharacterized membrane protein
MKKLNKIISTIVITGMLTLPVFAAIVRYSPHVNWASGPATSDVNWAS